jgi:hypothetical protein
MRTWGAGIAAILSHGLDRGVVPYGTLLVRVFTRHCVPGFLVPPLRGCGYVLQAFVIAATFTCHPFYLSSLFVILGSGFLRTNDICNCWC